MELREASLRRKGMLNYVKAVVFICVVILCLCIEGAGLRSWVNVEKAVDTMS